MLSLGKLRQVPGFEFSPAYLRRRRKIRSDDCFRANCLEVSFEALPPDVFAIVPIILNQQVSTHSLLYGVFVEKDEAADCLHLGWGARECDGLEVGPQPGMPRQRELFDEADFFMPTAKPTSTSPATVKDWSRLVESNLSVNSAEVKCFL
jgi:hypothetical protein